jgi:hypothetical protein
MALPELTLKKPNQAKVKPYRSTLRQSGMAWEAATEVYANLG